MNNQIENPVAQSNPDELFRDAPEQEIRCPHCGAIWGLRTIQPDACHDYPLYGWETADGKRECSSRDSSASPISTDCCYACALDKAGDYTLRQFCKTFHKQAFAAWLTDMERDDDLTVEAQDAIIGYYMRISTGKDMRQYYLDFIEAHDDEFRNWRCGIND